MMKSDQNLESCRQLSINTVKRSKAEKFIEHNHYLASLKSVNSEFIIGLYHHDELLGVAIFGQPAMPNVWKKYADNKEDLIELRRFCVKDMGLKNVSSYFMSKALRWVKKNSSYKVILSYADPLAGHTGGLYKACNYEFIGQGRKTKIVKNLRTGKVYPERVLRNKNSKKEKARFARELEILLQLGECVIDTVPGKLAFVYKLRR